MRATRNPKIVDTIRQLAGAVSTRDYRPGAFPGYVLHVLCFSVVCAFSACGSDGGQMSERDESGLYALTNSVNVDVTGRDGETIQLGDYFSDTTVVYAGERGVVGGTDFGGLRVQLPVEINVTSTPKTPTAITSSPGRRAASLTRSPSRVPSRQSPGRSVATPMAVHK